MAAARDTVAQNIKPLDAKKVPPNRFTAGSTIAAGQLVVMSSDGSIDPADTTSAAVTVLGVAVQGAVVGDVIDVVTTGQRINCLTGATIGATIHATDTAGEPGESAGTNAGIAGFALSATVMMVQPVTAS